MLPPNIYAGGTLDRAHQLRGNEAWIAQAWARPDAAIVPLWRSQALVKPDGTAALLPTPGNPPDDHPWAFLGLAQATAAPLFAIDLSAAEDPAIPPEAGVFTDLRTAAAAMPMPQAALLAYARALLSWRRATRFCGVCGAPCRAGQAGHVSVCTQCDAAFFPRTDPTVIMLVTHAGRALLGHNARFPARTMYSTLAGFVEPGESLEEAVAREVIEETGVRTGAVTYHSSQPWPYPMNLMLGFFAEAVSEAITVDLHELLDARWFTRAELRDPASHGFELPPHYSIARRLIDDWLTGER
jgi:NAD+ diphosphatase